MRRRMRGAFTERLLYKGAALFLALVLWLVVSTEQPTEDVFPVQLTVQKDTTHVLTEDLPTVTATVVGQLRDILRLSATPPALRVSLPPDSEDSVRVLLDPDDVELPVGIDGRVAVRSLSPSQLTLKFTTRVERRVPVRSRLRVTVDSGLRAMGPPRLDPESVTVVGTREAVELVSSVPTVAAEVQVRDTTGIVVPLDLTGLPVQVQPQQVRVRMPIAPAPVLLPWGLAPPGLGPGTPPGRR